MTKRIAGAAVLLLVAAVFGFTAPEPSTEALYRVMMLSFVAFLVASRVATIKVLGDGLSSSGVQTRPARTKVSREASEDHAPQFVRDPGFGPALSY